MRTTRSFAWQKFYSCSNLWHMRSFPQFPQHLTWRHLGVCVTVGPGICLRSSLFQLMMTNTEFTGKTVAAGLPHRTCISYFSLDIVWESFKNNLALHCDSIACIAFEKTAYEVYLTSLVISPSLDLQVLVSTQQTEHFIYLNPVLLSLFSQQQQQQQQQESPLKHSELWWFCFRIFPAVH